MPAKGVQASGPTCKKSFRVLWQKGPGIRKFICFANFVEFEERFQKFKQGWVAFFKDI